MLHTCNSHFPSDNIKNCTALHSPTYPGAVKLNWFPLRTKFLKTLRNQDLHAWSGRLHEFDSLMYQLDIWFTSWLQLSHQSVSLFSLLHSSRNSCVLIYCFSHFISIVSNLFHSLSESSVEMLEDDHYHHDHDMIFSCLVSCVDSDQLRQAHVPGNHWSILMNQVVRETRLTCPCYVVVMWLTEYIITQSFHTLHSTLHTHPSLFVCG